MEDTDEMERLEAPNDEKEQRFRIFQLIQKLAEDNPDKDKRIVKTYIGGAVDSVDIAKLLEGKPYVDVKELNSGDVLVVTTASESKFYYHVNTPISDTVNFSKGDLRRIDKDGNVKDYLDVDLQGANLGFSISANRVFLGEFGVSFRIPSEFDSLSVEDRAKMIEDKGVESIMPKVLKTSPVTDAGVIKNETILSQTSDA